MHTDPEVLSLLALGEQVGTGEDRLHVGACPECSGELSDLHRLVSLGRSVRAESAMAVPSPDVWARIRDELDFEPALEPPAEQAPFPHAVDRQSLLSIIKAAVSEPSRGSADESVAHATLAPIESLWAGASGEAVLATDELGRRILQVAVHANLPSSGLRQAWLVHRHDPRLKQTLGILDGPYGVWSVDRSIDLEQYAILDISQQGASETEHSGQTIVRGQLTHVSRG